MAELSLPSPQSALLWADHDDCFDRSQTIRFPPIVTALPAGNRKIKFKNRRLRILPNEQESTDSKGWRSPCTALAFVIFVALALLAHSPIFNSRIRDGARPSDENIAAHQHALVQALR